MNAPAKRCAMNAPAKRCAMNAHPTGKGQAKVKSLKVRTSPGFSMAMVPEVPPLPHPSRNIPDPCRVKRGAVVCAPILVKLIEKGDQVNRKSSTVRSAGSTSPVSVTDISDVPLPSKSNCTRLPTTWASVLPVAVKAPEPR